LPHSHTIRNHLVAEPEKGQCPLLLVANDVDSSTWFKQAED